MPDDDGMDVSDLGIVTVPSTKYLGFILDPLILGRTNGLHSLK